MRHSCLLDGRGIEGQAEKAKSSSVSSLNSGLISLSLGNQAVREVLVEAIVDVLLGEG